MTIAAYTRPRDLILDPFAGSAATAVAAKTAGRHYVAIELVWRYYQTACRRLEQL